MARSAWRLPGYRIEELVGSGSSGEVWRATVVSTGVAVALKRIWLSERAQRQAAISEAAVLSTLDHPHLMKLHEVHHVDDAIVLVLDLAGGGSLASLLARRGRLTVGETLTAIAPIGGALAYAHTEGVVHGDVSSANILFTDIGLPLLADLGMARLLGDSAPVRTTPSYIDPLVAAGDVPGPASDLFMLAGVALHALTGQPPWPGADAAKVLELAAATEDQPDFADRMAAAGVPEAVSTVVARALTVDPMRRGTAAQFALELRHAGEPVAVELSAGRPRHAAPMVDSWPLESVPAGEPATGSAPVPPFARALPLTYGVRAPSPFATPPSRGLGEGLRRRLRRLGRRPGGRLDQRRPGARLAAGIVAGVIVAVVAVVVVVGGLAARAGSSGRRTAAATRSAAGAGPAAEVAADTAVTSSRPAGHPASSPVASPVRTPAHAAHPSIPRNAESVLAALDRTRAAAFAQRDPDLLRQVYASPRLLARDRALLLTIVPVGCGLRGVHTRFAGVRAVPHGTGLQVHARISLPASTLVCRSVPSGTAPGTAIATVLVDLVRQGRGYRIVAETTG